MQAFIGEKALLDISITVVKRAMMNKIHTDVKILISCYHSGQGEAGRGGGQ